MITFCSKMHLLCATFQSLDPEIDAQIKARYRDKFKLDSEKDSSQQRMVSAIYSVVVSPFMPLPVIWYRRHSVLRLSVSVIIY